MEMTPRHILGEPPNILLANSKNSASGKLLPTSPTPGYGRVNVHQRGNSFAGSF
jgi:hypothetical protein